MSTAAARHRLPPSQQSGAAAGHGQSSSPGRGALGTQVTTECLLRPATGSRQASRAARPQGTARAPPRAGVRWAHRSPQSVYCGRPPPAPAKPAERRGRRARPELLHDGVRWAHRSPQSVYCGRPPPAPAKPAERRGRRARPELLHGRGALGTQVTTECLLRPPATGSRQASRAARPQGTARAPPRAGVRTGHTGSEGPHSNRGGTYIRARFAARRLGPAAFFACSRATDR